MLARFFKPNWQHSKSDKRLKAIAKLRATDADTQSILSKLALEDKDELVRLAAIEKLTHLALLIQISEQQPETIQQQSLHRISQLILSSDSDCTLKEKQSALSALNDSNLLTHIALNSNEERLRIQAINQLSDCQNLLVIAEKSQRAADRIAAAQRISSREALETLCKTARNRDKGVFKAAKESLQVISDNEAAERARKEKIAQLIDKIEQLSTVDFSSSFIVKLEIVESEWKPLSSSASEEQRSFFQIHQQKCSDTVIAETKRIREVEKQAAYEKEQMTKSHLLYSEICVLKESTNASLNQDELDKLEDKLASIDTQWTSLSPFYSKQEQQSYNKIKSQLNHLLDCYKTVTDSIELITQLTIQLSNNEVEPKSLTKQLQKSKRFINKLNWPTSHPKQKILIDLDTAIANVQKKLEHKDNHLNQLHNDLKTVLENLGISIKQGEIRTADKQIKKVDQLSKRLNGSLPTDLDLKAKQLHAELQEIREWQAYAVTPKKETLCQEMEALSESTLPVQERANQVRRIQKEWKLLDATDSVHSQQLWKRFKKASDAAYAPCDQHFSEQRKLRQNNLQERELICSNLESLTVPSSSNAEEWKEYEDKIRQAKQDWRTFSPVDRAPGKKLQVRLDAILSICDEPLKAFRADNAIRKQRLIDETTELRNSSDYSDATNSVKELQKEWKTIGPAPRNQERKLWNQFRENCSHIFESFYEGKQPDTAHNSILPLLDQACLNIEEIISSSCSISRLETEIHQAQSLINELDGQNALVPDTNKNAVKKGIAHLQQLQELLQSFQTEPYLALERKAAICEQLEHAILDQCSSDALSAIQQAWEDEPQSAHPLDEEITERFSTLVAIAKTPDALENTLSRQEQKLRTLCIRLEIASSQPSPVSDQALRMEYQMERLQQALAEQTQAFNLAEIKQLEQEWLCIPFAAHFEEFNERFENHLEAVY
ncbi:MAG: hypothetical protein CMI05_00870 [Oceanospirillaceae bacterium]|nr:hypothetical protein [Oceanospirillaceae bacterium]